jgi:hypothetical protein
MTTTGWLLKKPTKFAISRITDYIVVNQTHNCIVGLTWVFVALKKNGKSPRTCLFQKCTLHTVEPVRSATYCPSYIKILGDSPESHMTIAFLGRGQHGTVAISSIMHQEEQSGHWRPLKARQKPSIRLAHATTMRVQLQNTKLRGFTPQANYWGCRVVSASDPHGC